MKNILIWGTGVKTNEFLSHMINCKVLAYVETEPNQHYFNGKEVIVPGEIQRYAYDFVLITPLNPTEIVDMARCNKIDEKKMIVIHFSSLDKWHVYAHNFMLLKNIVDIEYFERIAQNQISIGKMYSSEMLSMLEKTDEYSKMKISIAVDNRLHFINGDVNRYYDIGEKNIIQFQKQWTAILGDYKFFFPQNWGKKKSLLYLRHMMEKNDINSPMYSDFETNSNVRRVLLVGTENEIIAIRCLNAGKKVDIYNHTLNETFEIISNGRNEIKYIQKIESLYEQEYDAARVDIDDFEEVKKIIEALNHVDRIDIITYYKKIKNNIIQYLESIKYEYRIVGKVYLPSLDEEMNLALFSPAMIRIYK